MVDHKSEDRTPPPLRVKGVGDNNMMDEYINLDSLE